MLALLEAKPEKAAELAALLEQARELALAESQTVSWYAFQRCRRALRGHPVLSRLMVPVLQRAAPGLPTRRRQAHRARRQGDRALADPAHLQSTGFVLGPHGNVIVSMYASGAVGRLLPEEVAGLVDYLKFKRS